MTLRLLRWLTFVIPATQEVEIGRIIFKAKLGKKISTDIWHY
jgi:hypothetical protein